MSAVVLVALTPVCVAVLAGLAAVRDALSGPTRRSKFAGPTRVDGGRGGDTMAAEVGLGAGSELGAV